MLRESDLLEPPFTISLDGDFGEITCKKILRHMPKKRVVALAQWRQKLVVVKIFFHSNAKRHLGREVIGSKHLSSAKILSPKLLLSGSAEKNQFQVVIYEYIENAVEVSYFVGGTQALELAMKVVAVLAQMHNVRLTQKDLHSQNFLVKDDYVYVLDAASVVLEDSSIGLASALKDLAKIIVCFSFFDKEVIRQLFIAYVEARKLLVKEKYFKDFKRYIVLTLQSEKENYLNKSFRNCTRIKYQKSLKKRYAFAKAYSGDDLRFFLDRPERYITENTLLYLKRGNTCSVFKCKLDLRLSVLKRYNLKSFWHGVKRLFQRSRADKSWYAANLLGYFGIKTSKPIAFYEKRIGCFRRQAYYLSEHIPGLPLDLYFDTQEVVNQENKKIANRLIVLLNNLYRLKISHGDMKASNFLLYEGDVYLIDLDSLTEHRNAAKFERAALKDRERFLKNWENNPVAKELFECLKIKK